jgi:PAS domain S-box-containing protein
MKTIQNSDTTKPAQPEPSQQAVDLELLIANYQQKEIELERLLAAEQAQRRIAEALYQTGLALNSSLNYEHVLDQVLEQAQHLIPHDAASIMLIEGNIARTFRRRGYDRFAAEGDIVPLNFNITDTPTFRAMQEIGRPLVIPSIDEAGNPWLAKSEAGWIKSYLGAPIYFREQTIGFINLNSATPGFFGPADLEPLQAFANLIAIALENARLYDQGRQEVIQRVRALKKERNFISAVLDTAGALVMVLNRRGRIIRFNRTCEQTTGYTFEEVRGKYWWDLFLPLDQVESIKAEFEKLGLDHPSHSYESYCLAKNGQQRLIAWSNTVLLDHRGAVEYILHTGIDLTERKQAEEELKATNQQLQALTQRLQRELNLAQKIQQSLLPASQPTWTGLDLVCYSMPAREVGGDFYAYHTFEDQHGLRHFAIAVGDVTGKGMPAALLMATSLTALQSAITHTSSPIDLLAELDLAIEPYTRATHQNCALCYAEITPPTLILEPWVMRVANAGCITPLVCRANGAVEWVDIGGIPLGVGVSAQVNYTEAILTLAKGDSVIFTSDGVIEATNALDHMFGFERLEQAVARSPRLSAAATLTHLLAEVTTFTGPTEPHDDLTIVVLQV